jgi:transcriptional regulator with XRE-family HTH domain
MSYDYRKLQGRIKEVCGTQAVYAKRIGISGTTLSKKLNNKTDFSSSEIQRSIEALDIEADDLPVYFFTVN